MFGAPGLLWRLLKGCRERTGNIGRVSVHKLVAKAALIVLLPALAACGGQPGGYTEAESNEMAAYNEPSRTVPDYSVRGATDLMSIGIGIF